MKKLLAVASLLVGLFAAGAVQAGVAGAQAYPPDDVEATVIIDVVADIAATDAEVAAAVEALDDLNFATASPEELQEALDNLLEALRAALPDLEINAITALLVTVNPDGTLSEVVPALIVVRDATTGESAVVTVGAGYQPGSPVTITVESEPIELGEVNATDGGKFIAIAQLPAELEAGKHTLKATGADPAGKERIVGQPIEVKEAPSTEIEADNTSATRDLAAAATDGDDSGGGALAPLAIGAGVAILGIAAAFLLKRKPAASS